MVNAKSRAHRILRPLRNYAALKPDGQQHDQLPTLAGDDQWIGVYRNNETALSHSILAFSEKAIHVFECGAWISIPYARISGVNARGGKGLSDGLYLAHNGEDTFVPINGRCGKFSDAFEVMRFLDRVREDQADKGRTPG